MKNTFTVIYSIFASIAFLFALTFFGVNLYKEYSYGEIGADRKIASIVTDINSSAINPDITTKKLLEKLNKSIGNLNDFSYISIAINDVEILKYPSNVEYSSTSSNLTKSYDKLIQTDIGKFRVLANVYLLKPGSIFYYAKISFLIILIVTIITIVLIIYLNLSNSQTSEVESEKSQAFVNKINEMNQEIVEKNTDIQNEVKASNVESVIFDSEKSETSKEEAQETASKSVTENDPIKDKKTEEIKEEAKKEELSEPVEKVQLPIEEKPMELYNSEEDSPSGLFNPVTGFGWESYLLTRLESEINRAIASEIDLSLFIIQLPGLTRDSEMVKNVCNYLTIQFQFKDLLFEYKDDCLVAMKISMNLDEALNFADKIYADIRNIIDGNNCYIGISTRSIRMVSGERLLHESDEALVHAHDDPESPIIAFRVDAEKYRQFLEQNKGNEQ